MPRRLSREMDERTAGSSTPRAASRAVSAVTDSQPPSDLGDRPYTVTIRWRGRAPRSTDTRGHDSNLRPLTRPWVRCSVELMIEESTPVLYRPARVIAQ